MKSREPLNFIQLKLNVAASEKKLACSNAFRRYRGEHEN